uniref:Uncharacterized protein n=1 Tax=Lepeophtheirus salmonis TaxID=72036 RepID=A0A0K2TDG8_LEPSM
MSVRKITELTPYGKLHPVKKC